MSQFIKKCLFVGLTLFSNLTSVNSWKWVLMDNQKCQVRPQIMSRTNEKRYIERHKRCKCRCRLDASICNNKQQWNEHKCRWECKELIDKGACKKGFIWNPSNCEFECYKSCDFGEYLDYKNCKYKKNWLIN